MIDDVELLIAGGGLTGLLLGVACGGAGLTVGVVDRQDPAESIRDDFDGRSSAIAHGSQRVLDAIGLWPSIAADAEPILEIRVVDDDSSLFLHYDHRELESHTPLGYIVENRVLRRVLMERVRSMPNLVLFAPFVVDSALSSSLATTASLSGGGQIRARLIAAAEGQKSTLRGAAGIPTVEWRYAQAGIVTTVQHELAARFGDFLGTIEPIGPRWAYPLALLLATSYIAPRLALVGEAAHVIHPIAGQGLNLGIRDVAVLAELVIDARRLGLDIGDTPVLHRYQQWRRFDAMALAAVTDGLNRLFSNSLPPIRLARDVGLAVVQRLRPLKRLLMRDAMGVAGDLPRLVRGEPL